MKKYVPVSVTAIVFLAAGLFISSAFAKQRQQTGYILKHEKDIAIKQPVSS
jgi:hypothetical protein